MSTPTQPAARVILDSISPEGVRLTTCEVVMHRFVLAEFNTHRVFSRNSASSRAIPIVKQIERVETDLAWPVSWPAEQKGMQGGEPLSPQWEAIAKEEWLRAAREAVHSAKVLKAAGLHKSVTNRLLEPFMWHTVVVTSTAYGNWDSLRLDPDAQPEIRAAAEVLRDARDGSTPKLLQPGEWHLPLVHSEDWEAMSKHVGLEGLGKSMYPQMAKVSAARCARTSYLTHDGRRDLTEDLRLYGDLVDLRIAAGKGIHWSPLEHVATPWPENRQETPQLNGDPDPLTFRRGGAWEWVEVPTDHLPRVGNLLGWRSLRTEVEATHKARTFS